MRFELTDKNITALSSDVLLLFAFSQQHGKKSTFTVLDQESFDKKLLEEIAKAGDLESFTAKAGEQLVFIPSSKTLYSRVVVLGLGKKEVFSTNTFRNAGGVFAKRFKYKIDSASLAFPETLQSLVSLDVLAHAFAEGVLLGLYEFYKYKKPQEKARDFGTILIAYRQKSEEKLLTKSFEKAELFAAGTKLARDLVNEQAYIATPTYLANLAKEIATKNPKTLSCKVLDKAQCEKLGMEAFLSIARAAGDEVPPQFIILEYTPAKVKNKKKLAVIGKGITFDSGGINVKPGDHMKDMKMDMAGAASVLGVFSVISDLAPDFPVMGIIAATPNLISSTATVPGDVVRALNGKSIEILNTDAEGRVTMADSLSYAVQKGATEIIDLATLTGAAMVALGEDIAALFSNNHDFAKTIRSAAHDAGEKVWEMPLEPEYKKLNKSDVADIANIPASRYGGTITAALFLEEFVSNTTWAHLDIAGPAFLNKPSDISGKGGTGFGVRMLLTLLQQK